MQSGFHCFSIEGSVLFGYMKSLSAFVAVAVEQWWNKKVLQGSFTGNPVNPYTAKKEENRGNETARSSSGNGLETR
jgi:hypothetical protein